MRGINHLLLRFVYLLISWLVALKPVLEDKTPDKLAVCSTLFLFFIPLIVDYFGFVVITKRGKFFRYFGTYSTIIAVTFVIIVFFGGINFDAAEKEIGVISLDLLWKLVGVWIVLSLVDWITLSFHPVELKLQKQLQKKVRKQQEKLLEESLVQKRISYYEKKYGKPGRADV